MNIFQDKEGNLAATLDSPDQGAYEIPVTKIGYKEKNIYLEAASIKGIFRGKFNDTFKEISGNWEQGGSSLPLNLNSSVVSEKEVSVEFPHLDKVLGKWSGILKVRGVELRIVFNFLKNAAGKLKITMDSPDQEAKGNPINHIEYNDRDILMEVAGIGGAYKGKFNEKFEDLDGTWKQGGGSYPLNFKKTQNLEN